MRAIFVAWLIGNLACFASTAALWVMVPLLLTPLIGATWIVLYPTLAIVPPLLIGGYAAARLVKSLYRSRYVALGATVGFTASAAMLAILLRSSTGNPAWLLVPLFAGAILSALGALLGGRVVRGEVGI